MNKMLVLSVMVFFGINFELKPALRRGARQIAPRTLPILQRDAIQRGPFFISSRAIQSRPYVVSKFEKPTSLFTSARMQTPQASPYYTDSRRTVFNFGSFFKSKATKEQENHLKSLLKEYESTIQDLNSISAKIKYWQKEISGQKDIIPGESYRREEVRSREAISADRIVAQQEIERLRDRYGRLYDYREEVVDKIVNLSKDLNITTHIGSWSSMSKRHNIVEDLLYRLNKGELRLGD